MTRTPMHPSRRSHTRQRTAGAVLAALTVAATGAALAAPAAQAAPTGGGSGPAGSTASAGSAGSARVRPACGVARPGHARCYSVVRTDAAAHTDAAAAKPKGYGPADLSSAYTITGSGGKGTTIAIVDAFDAPHAAADLATYRKTYGLPPCGKGCFTKLNQKGEQGHYPDADPGWGLEISLDLDMASAACPSCKITLVEGDDNSLDNLAAAVDTAVKAGADVVSNSYGADEFGGMAPYGKHYQHKGVPVLASTGDYGFAAASFPAVYPGVTAVGGTTLTKAKNARGWSEKVWGNGTDSGFEGGAGSGCSAYIAKPSYQKDKHCDMRTVGDVSADADPDTGLAVYDSVPLGDGTPPGWLVVGGTSASTPYVAGLVARSGHAKTFTTGALYTSSRKNLYDPVGGSNGFCGKDYLCTGKKGYDAPTGVGSPHGLGAFG